MSREINILKGLAAGAIGGLVASWTMNKFQGALSKLAGKSQKSHGAQSLQQGSPQHGVAKYLRERQLDEQDDTAAERTANLIAAGLFNRRLSDEEKEAGGTASHYSFGITTGACYGAAAEFLPALTRGAGLPFGGAVWVVADEIVVPVLGLSKLPHEYPLSTHAYAFSSHLVYGLTAEVVRNRVRRLLAGI